VTAESQLSVPRLVRLVAEGDRTSAVVSVRAASLRALTVDGAHLVEPTCGAVEPPGMAGAVLVPWPNRVEDGTWWYGGEQQRLVVTEPDLGNAIHGLLSGVDFALAGTSRDMVELRTVIEPQPGYPFQLDVSVRYRLRQDGVRAQIEVRNRSTRPAPVAVGVHPYIRLGDVPLDTLGVALDADRMWTLDGRHLPLTHLHLPGAPDDNWPRPVVDLPGHALFQRVTPKPGGLRHTIHAADGRRIELRADPTMAWTQWYVAPDLKTDEGTRRALAIEPMSAPPNGLRTGEGMHTLTPGGTRTWTWQLSLRQRESRVR
jgi:aldose 1-epimerase